MSGNTREDKRKYAQSYFDKGEQRKNEAARAHDEHTEKNDALIANTLRLRALRLAKEAQDAQIAKDAATDTSQKNASIDIASKNVPQKPTLRKKISLAV